MTLSNPRRSRRKELIRESDRTLYDVTERRRISFAELRDYMGDGGYFEARRHDTGADCTTQVLQELLADNLVAGLVPGLGGGNLPGPLDLFLRLTELRSGTSDSRRDWSDRDDGRRRSWSDEPRARPAPDAPREFPDRRSSPDRRRDESGERGDGRS